VLEGGEMKHLIQKLKCAMPFSFSYFLHKPEIVRQLSPQSQLIKCQACGKLFAINHDVRVILPWESMKNHYKETEWLNDAPDPPMP